MLNPQINASPEMGNDRKGNIYVTNTVSSPESRSKKIHVTPLKSADSNSITSDMRDRSESFAQKARNNKQFKILGTTIKSEIACTELLENQSQLISEFILKSRNKSKAGPDSEKEVSTVVQTARNIDSAERMRRSTMDQVPRNKVAIASDLKKRPMPAQKPIAYVTKFDPYEDHAENIYENNCVIKNNDYFGKGNDYINKNNDYVHQSNDFSQQNNDYVHKNNDFDNNNDNCDDNIYENVSKKLSEDVVDTKAAAKTDYVAMHGNNVIPRSATFCGTPIKPILLGKSLDNNLDDCGDSEDSPEDYVVMGSAAQCTTPHERSLSVQFNKTDLVHLRGDIGCVYESTDYSYIYEINPFHGHGQPFTKTKHKAKPMPCYCHEDPEREMKVRRKINACRTRPIGGSQNIYYSCEDIYVSMKTKEGIYSSLNDLSGYGKKKMPDDEAELNWTETDGKLYKFDGSGFNESNQEKSLTLDGKSGSLLKKKLLQVKQLLADW